MNDNNWLALPNEDAKKADIVALMQTLDHRQRRALLALVEAGFNAREASLRLTAQGEDVSSRQIKAWLRNDAAFRRVAEWDAEVAAASLESSRAAVLASLTSVMQMGANALTVEGASGEYVEKPVDSSGAVAAAKAIASIRGFAGEDGTRRVTLEIVNLADRREIDVIPALEDDR